MRSVAIGFSILAVSAAVLAQTTGPGLTWSGTTGGATGSFMPSCSSLQVSALRGDAVTMRAWGDPGSPFLIGVAATATQCLPVPGVGNGLVLDLPAFPVVGGLLTQLTPCLSCPPAFEPIGFVVPLSLPLGSSVSFQAIGLGNGQLALTTAITVTVQ